MLPEKGERLEAFGGVAEEFGLLGDHGNMVGGTIDPFMYVGNGA